jgi:ABC-2 type transport system ATP-binding protein
MSYIKVDNVSKEFKVVHRDKGFKSAVTSLFNRKYDTVKAVEGVSFDVEKGELVGYIGPNGAGKSTTIKMLTGILVPSSGSITVNGRIPHLNRKENAKRIGVVFGQRSSMEWDLPMEDTFDLFQKIYRIDNDVYKRNVSFYIELLEMQGFLKRPVRQLSLGEKMRAEIAVALLHDPEILFLDEPTIGLDVVAKDKIRKFLKKVNIEKKITLMLTTHDMDDIEQICDRIIMIDKGKLLHDSTLGNFKRSYGGGYTVTVIFNDANLNMPVDSRLNLVSEEGVRKVFLAHRGEIETGEALKFFIEKYDVKDLTVSEIDIDEIVRNAYEKNSKVFNADKIDFQAI